METGVSLATPLQPAVRLGEKGGRLQAPLTLAFPAELPKAQTFADMNPTSGKARSGGYLGPWPRLAGRNAKRKFNSG